MKVGYMGIPGSFSESAAKHLVLEYGLKDAELVPMVNAYNILDALQKDEIDYGVPGKYNTLAGPVQEFVDSFGRVSYHTHIEYTMPIHHCLFIKPDASEDQIRVVASHPHALKQTEITRARRYPQWEECEIEDTALGAKWLSEGELGDDVVVICSRDGGELFGLKMIAENIEDSDDNQTTFLLVTLEK